MAPQRIALVAISGSTIVSGAVQAIAPAVVLRLVGAQVNPTTTHFFRLIGLFMILFGGMLGAEQAADEKNLLPWCAAQKLVAVAGVTLGVRKGIFRTRALGVTAFDCWSFLIMLRECLDREH